jgi:hypothetical protein
LPIHRTWWANGDLLDLWMLESCELLFIIAGAPSGSFYLFVLPSEDCAKYKKESGGFIAGD